MEFTKRLRGKVDEKEAMSGPELKQVNEDSDRMTTTIEGGTKQEL